MPPVDRLTEFMLQREGSSSKKKVGHELFKDSWNRHHCCQRVAGVFQTGGQGAQFFSRQCAGREEEWGARFWAAQALEGRVN